MKVSGWGRYPVIESRVLFPRSISELRKIVLSETNMIARGNGRSYGDSAINSSATIEMKHFNRLLSFDHETGMLEVEAGILLEDIIEVFLPKGWFPLITPGTKKVSIGGAIAADVHGKSHHKDGSFRSCVVWIEVMGPDGSLVRCSREENKELFELSLGGMGLFACRCLDGVAVCWPGVGVGGSGVCGGITSQR